MVVIWIGLGSLLTIIVFLEFLGDDRLSILLTKDRYIEISEKNLEFSSSTQPTEKYNLPMDSFFDFITIGKGFCSIICHLR